MDSPITDQQLDEIQARAAGMFAHADLGDEDHQREAERLTGTDVPLLLADLRRARDRVAELEVGLNDLAALVSQWYSRAETAEARAAELAAVHAFLDEQDRAARLFELPTPAWVVAVRAASAPPAAPLSASPASSVSEPAQSPAGAPTGPRRTLTPNEYDAAWHAVEGAAGDEGADPGTVLHAVLNRLGIQWQDAARPTA